MSTLAQNGGDTRSTIGVVVPLLFAEKFVYIITQDTVSFTITSLLISFLLHRYAELREETGEPLRAFTPLSGGGVQVLMDLLLWRTLRTNWIKWI